MYSCLVSQLNYSTEKLCFAKRKTRCLHHVLTYERVIVAAGIGSPLVPSRRLVMTRMSLYACASPQRHGHYQKERQGVSSLRFIV